MTVEPAPVMASGYHVLVSASRAKLGNRSALTSPVGVSMVPSANSSNSTNTTGTSLRLMTPLSISAAKATLRIWPDIKNPMPITNGASTKAVANCRSPDHRR